MALIQKIGFGQSFSVGCGGAQPPTPTFAGGGYFRCNWSNAADESNCMAESKSGGIVSNSKHRSEFLYDFALSKINYLAGGSE